jgi:hypothetical protein
MLYAHDGQFRIKTTPDLLKGCEAVLRILGCPSAKLAYFGLG